MTSDVQKDARWYRNIAEPASKCRRSHILFKTPMLNVYVVICDAFEWYHIIRVSLFVVNDLIKIFRRHRFYQWFYFRLKFDLRHFLISKFRMSYEKTPT